MITKLPIVIDCRKVVGFKSSSKIIFHNFYIKKENNNIKLDIINPYNYLDYIKLPCVNNLDCIYYLKVTLPLVFTVYDSKIFSPYFFYTAIKSKNNNDLDFFDNFINFYNKNEKVKYNFININELDKYANYILKYP